MKILDMPSRLKCGLCGYQLLQANGPYSHSFVPGGAIYVTCPNQECEQYGKRGAYPPTYSEIPDA